MSGKYQNSGDPLTKGLSMVVALGALAFGAAAALMNSERTKQMRQDLERQIGDLSNKVEASLAQRRPDIEDAIQKSRKVAVESLEKAKGVVEQSADKANEYVQRAATKTSNVAENAGDRAQDVLESGADKIDDAAATFNADAGEMTRRFDTNGNGTQENTDSSPTF